MINSRRGRIPLPLSRRPSVLRRGVDGTSCWSPAPTLWSAALQQPSLHRSATRSLGQHGSRCSAWSAWSSGPPRSQCAVGIAVIGSALASTNRVRSFEPAWWSWWQARSRRVHGCPRLDPPDPVRVAEAGGNRHSIRRAAQPDGSLRRPEDSASDADATDAASDMSSSSAASVRHSSSASGFNESPMPA